MENGWISVAEAAEDSGLHVATIRYWVQQGRLPGVFLKKKGAHRGVYLIPRDAWNKFMGRGNGS